MAGASPLVCKMGCGISINSDTDEWMNNSTFEGILIHRGTHLVEDVLFDQGLPQFGNVGFLQALGCALIKRHYINPEVESEPRVTGVIWILREVRDIIPSAIKRYRDVYKVGARAAARRLLRLPRPLPVESSLTVVGRYETSVAEYDVYSGTQPMITSLQPGDYRLAIEGPTPHGRYGRLEKWAPDEQIGTFSLSQLIARFNGQFKATMEFVEVTDGEQDDAGLEDEVPTDDFGLGRGDDI